MSTDKRQHLQQRHGPVVSVQSQKSGGVDAGFEKHKRLVQKQGGRRQWSRKSVGDPVPAVRRRTTLGSTCSRSRQLLCCRREVSKLHDMGDRISRGLRALMKHESHALRDADRTESGPNGHDPYFTVFLRGAHRASVRLPVIVCVCVCIGALAFWASFPMSASSTGVQ